MQRIVSKGIACEPRTVSHSEPNLGSHFDPFGLPFSVSLASHFGPCGLRFWSFGFHFGFQLVVRKHLWVYNIEE